MIINHIVLFYQLFYTYKTMFNNHIYLTKQKYLRKNILLL